MRRKLPPFPAIRAFESSARHLSFKMAADELCLTTSAISHQIKALENYLGLRLFYRKTRGVVLTEEGATFLTAITGILDRMATETARVSKREDRGPLSVRATPGFVRWLVPRLSRFHEAYPAIELELSASMVLADFAGDDVDINIRWGFDPVTDLRSTPLIACSRYPIISPDLLCKGPPIRKPDDLLHYTMLHETGCPNFEKWIAFAGANIESTRRGLSFAHYDHLLQAAIEGHGIGIGFDFVVANDIEAKRLVRLFDIEYPAQVLYSMVTPRSWEERPRISAFRSWLINEVGALPLPHVLPGLLSSGKFTADARP
jgi:LysR family transcriptional regulator, glycine cleavage system transcriptional activator